MPYGLYFSIAGLGIFVAAALWPPQRPRVLANITYILGMVINEIPHYGALLLAIPPCPPDQEPMLHRAKTLAWAYLAGDIGRPVFPYCLEQTL